MSQPAQSPQTKGWTQERRAKQSAAIRNWSPWSRSTGPKTAFGKTRAAQNAYKHGTRSAHMRLLHQALAAQRQCLRLGRVAGRLLWKNPSNELLARLHCRFNTFNHIFHIKLAQYLYYEELCKKLAFSPPLGQIVNDNSPIAVTRLPMQASRRWDDREKHDAEP